MAQPLFSTWSARDTSHAHGADAEGNAPTKDHGCDRCGRWFKRAEHLNRHLRTHTKEKPFRCHCGAPFARKDLLKRHIRLSHPERFSSLRQSMRSEPAATINGDGEFVADTTTTLQNHQQQQQQPYSHHDGHAANGPNAFLSPHPPPEAAPSTVPYSIALSSPTAAFMMDGSLEEFDFDALLNTSPEEQAHFQQLANFMDSMGLLSDFVTFDPIQDGPSVEANTATAPLDDESNDATSDEVAQMDPRSRPISPFRFWLPSPPPTDHLAGVAAHSDSARPSHMPPRPIFSVTREHRAWLEAQLVEFRDVVPGFYLPSQHSLNRYLVSFIDGFHSHLPHCHVPTSSIQDLTPDTILAFAATGAQYVFEHRNADRLFYAGKAILLERMHRQRERRAHQTEPSPESVIAAELDCGRARRLKRVSAVIDPSPEVLQHPRGDSWARHQSLAAAVTLMGYSAWEGANLVRESLRLASVVVECLRDIAIAGPTGPAVPPSADRTWRQWAQEESERRVELVAFTFLETLSIAYNVSPYLLNSQFDIRLPCTTAEWMARTEDEWLAARHTIVAEQMHYQQALAVLFDTSKTNSPALSMTTPFGNYILLHGLLQRILLASEVSSPTDPQIATMSRGEFDQMEYALRSWTVVWQKTPESSLDPRNDNGPIPFTSSALLGLAYVRLHLLLGPHRSLETRDKHRIATSLLRSPAVRRGHRILPAILYAAHALSLPVRLGIESVGRSQAFFWSIRHGLSSLECAVLLAKWLLAIHATHADTPVNKNERRMIRWVRQIVREALESSDSEDPTDDDDRGLDQTVFVNALSTRELAVHVLCIWSRMFRCNVQWPFLNVIGLSLQEYARLLELEFASVTHQGHDTSS